jgi:hypothetical protein
MVPVGRGVTHEYQDMFDSFTCCVGTGMENHALHGDGIYYQAGDKLWVNLYTPSTAEWKEAGAKLTMETTFPEGESASLALNLAASKKFTVALRRPAWAGANFSVKVNNEAVTELAPPGSYVEITRVWKDGDIIALVLPKELHEDPLPDNPRCVALMWGPLVLAGDLGPEQRRRGAGRSNDVPVLVAAEMPIANWLKPVEGPRQGRAVPAFLSPAGAHLCGLLGHLHSGGMGKEITGIRKPASARGKAQTGDGGFRPTGPDADRTGL